MQCYALQSTYVLRFVLLNGFIVLSVEYPIMLYNRIQSYRASHTANLSSEMLTDHRLLLWDVCAGIDPRGGGVALAGTERSVVGS